MGHAGREQREQAPGRSIAATPRPSRRRASAPNEIVHPPRRDAVRAAGERRDASGCGLALRRDRLAHDRRSPARDIRWCANYSPDMSGYATSGERDAPPAACFRARLFHGLRTEGTGVGREAAAIGVGVFIGCLPFYGFHLASVLDRRHALSLESPQGLSRREHLESAHGAVAALQRSSRPAPGSATDAFSRSPSQAIREDRRRSRSALDLLVGSVVRGRRARGGRARRDLLHGPQLASRIAGSWNWCGAASDRYVGTSITAWEFARGKLRGDPLYRATLSGRLLPSGGTLIDVGCGQGLTLALLRRGRRRSSGEGTLAGRRSAATAVRSNGRDRDSAAAGGARAAGAEERCGDRDGDARTVPSARRARFCSSTCCT